MDKNRLEKINAAIMEETAKIISNNLRNPGIKGLVSVLYVDTDNDLYQSTIKVSIYCDNEKDRLDSLNALKHSAGYIRHELSRVLDLRKTPILTFVLDTSIEYSDKINKILAEIAKKDNQN